MCINKEGEEGITVVSSINNIKELPLCHLYLACIVNQCPSCCMSEEGPDWTKMQHESLVNTAKFLIYVGATPM